jgi:hypothetical protein
MPARISQRAAGHFCPPPCLLSHNEPILYNRGLQFYNFFEISIGIKRRLIDIAKKITFHFLQTV